MADTNPQLAAIFQQMADLQEILGANRFKVNAMARAARVLEDLGADIASVPREKLEDIEGIGKGLADRIREYLDTGRMQEHEALKEQVPPGVLELLGISGLGPKTVATLWQQGGVVSRKTLQEKLSTGELEKLPRLGKKKLEQIGKNLQFLDAAGQRTRIGSALPTARLFVERLRGMKGVQRAEYAGSLRRGRETVGDLDLLVAASPKEGPAITQAFTEMEPVADVSGVGPTKASIRTGDGLQVDLRVVEPDAFGAAMLYFTGSKDHNIALRERAIARGLSLNEYGLHEMKDGKAGRRIASKTEEEVYQALDLAWIPPELREAHGEIRRAEAGDLPDLITLDDLKAELHAHTVASDGAWSIEQYARFAADRGFHTVAVTDHSKGQAQANGLTAARLEKHIEAIREVAAKLEGTIRVLAGSEVDILTDGSLDYPDSLLKELDVVVASPHAALTQEPAKATERLLKAIDNPWITILGHPTGRLVGRRPGLSPDMSRVVRAAAERGIALEINANSHRLDLRDTHARMALEAGCTLAINTDAHSHVDMDQLIYGVLTARRAGARAEDVVNTLSDVKLGKWLDLTRR